MLNWLPAWIRRSRPESSTKQEDLVKMLLQQGNALLAEGKLEDARARYQAAATADPHSASTHVNLGFVLRELGDSDLARQSLERALALDPNQVDALYLLGSIAEACCDTDIALAYYQRAIAVRPDFSVGRSSLCRLLLAMGKLKESEAIAASGLALEPHSTDLLLQRGNAFLAQQRWRLALADFESVLTGEPDCAAALNQKGIALHHLGQVDEALTSFDHAIQVSPDFATAYSNRGLVLNQSRRVAEAIEEFDKAIALEPDLIEAHWSRSLSYLLLGNFAQGWADFEWRWKQGELKTVRRESPRPRWTGKEDIQGKRVLLYAEQGLGDTIQFCRYARNVAERGGTVILEIPSDLVQLLSQVAGVSRVVTTGSVPPDFEYQCPLLSLPAAFNVDLGTIDGAAYLEAAPERIQAWSQKLGSRRAPRVGLIWSGNALHKNDVNRSIPFKRFKELMISGVDYFCLQKEIKADDANELVTDSRVRLVGSELKDFSDTAAIVELMDLVITVDTSVAHLAGAMGKETWVLLPFVPDWRWLMDRSDCPWYWSVRLFRQNSRGDWSPVLASVRRAFGERFGLA